MGLFNSYAYLLSCESVSTDFKPVTAISQSSPGINIWDNNESCWVRRNIKNFTKRIQQILNHLCLLVNLTLNAIHTIIVCLAPLHQHVCLRYFYLPTLSSCLKHTVSADFTIYTKFLKHDKFYKYSKKITNTGYLFMDCVESHQTPWENLSILWVVN